MACQSSSSPTAPPFSLAAMFNTARARREKYLHSLIDSERSISPTGTHGRPELSHCRTPHLRAYSRISVGFLSNRRTKPSSISRSGATCFAPGPRYTRVFSLRLRDSDSGTKTLPVETTFPRRDSESVKFARSQALTILNTYSNALWNQKQHIY